MRLMEGSLALALPPVCVANGQDMFRGIDRSSPDMTMAEMTHPEAAAAVAAAPKRHGVDLLGKRLSGLDPSSLDLSGANLQAARLNHANLRMPTSTGRRWTKPGRLKSIRKRSSCLGHCPKWRIRHGASC